MAKGKKGVQVDELFLSLGIDTSDLEADLIGADKSVSDGIAILKTKMLQNKLKMEIDQSAFVGAENSMAAVANRTQHLTTQMNLQKVTVAALSAAYQKATADENLSAAAKDRMLTRLLREQKAETDLARQIKETNAARSSVGAAVGGTGLEGITSLSSRFAMLTGGIAGIAAAFGIDKLATAMKDATLKAIDVGESIFRLSQRMHLSGTDAAELGRLLSITGVDATAFSTTMIRLDRSIENAGHSGNDTTRALKDFGVSLTDETGKLLPMNAQLAKLAEGYKEASKRGEEEEFVTRILGARGQALIPVLAEYAEALERIGKTKTSGIDPQKAHEAEMSMKQLTEQTKQFEVAFGSSMLSSTKRINQLTGFIGALVEKMNQLNSKSEELEKNRSSFLPYWLMDKFMSMISQPVPPPEHTEESMRNAKGDADAAKKATENSKINDQTLKAQQELDAALYKSTHTRIENEIYEIDQKKNAAIKSGVEETVATQQSEQAKAEVIKKYNKEIEESHIALEDALLKATDHGLQARLGEINRERDAWVKKAHDEVLATEWAENEKIKAVKDAVRARYGEEIRAVEAAMKASQDPLAAYNKAHEAVMKNMDIESNAFDFVRNQLGVKLPGDTSSRVQISNNTISSITEVVKTLQYNAQLLEKASMRNPGSGGGTVNMGGITVHLGIQTAQSEVDIVRTADNVANIITRKVEDKLSDIGGVKNDY